MKSEPKMEVDDDQDSDIISIDHSSIIVKPSRRDNVTAAVSGNKFKCILDACSNKSCKLKPVNKLTYIKNSLQIQLKKFIRQYYQVRQNIYKLILSNLLIFVID